MTSASLKDLFSQYVQEEAALLVFTLDSDGLILNANHYAERLVGENLLQQKLGDIIVDFTGTVKLPDILDEPDRVHLINVKTAGGLPQTFYFRFLRAGSEVLAVGEINSLELETLRKELVSASNELSNLSRELHKKNAELLKLNALKNELLGVARASEERYRLVVENADEAIVVAQDGMFRFVNGKACEITGYSDEELLSRPFLDFIHGDDRSMVMDHHLRRLRGETLAARYPFRLVGKDGSTRWVEIGAALIEWEGRAATLNLLTDITERKRVEEELRVSEERFRTVFELASVGMAQADPDTGRWQRVNHKLCEITGYSAEELIGKRFFEITHPDDQQHDWEAFQELKNGKVNEYQREKRYLRKDGTIIWVNVNVTLLVNVDRSTVGFAVIEDITRRKQAEEDRLRLEQRIQQAQKAESLGRMAGAIAHLFNNQLGVVMGNLELALMDLSGDAPIREDLNEAMRAARRSAEISGLMLTYLGQSAGMPEPLDLSDVCRQNLPMLQNAMPEGIALKTDLLSSGPIVSAHANEMLQVLTNLINNGSESIGNGAGTVTLATSIIQASEIPESHLVPIGWKPAAETFACLEVTDTGCGIAEEDLNKIFDPFFTTKFTGRGLGLAVVLGLVKTWGGAISVESKNNQGSILRVLLPLITDELPRSSENAMKPHLIEPGGKVLLADDQDSVRKMAESMLRRMGYEVLAASGGAEAVGLFLENLDQVRFVITDLTMPGMDGWHTLVALREIRPLIPVILVSGHDEAHAMVRDYPEQPHLFLHKPYSKAELQAAIDKALQSQ